ncbi:MAG: NDP-sugar synthase [Burkholderiales bacterium]|nr:NDP-sugar synthase [Burkholderiales bacterium]
MTNLNISRALILADRESGDLQPLAEGLPPALVPIAGKPVLQHTIEDLWEAGVREALVVIPAGDRRIRAELGNGQRLGLTLRYIESAGRRLPSELISDTGPWADAAMFLTRGDVLRGRSAASLLARAAASDAEIVHGVSGARPVGIALLRRQCAGVNQLDWIALRHPPPAGTECLVDLGPIGFALLDDLPSLFEASLGVLDGTFAGLAAEGRQVAGSPLYVGPRTALASTVVNAGVCRIGTGAELHDGVELAGHVDIGDRCVIDDGAELFDSVVMSGTYVGRGVRLQSAIASGSWLYRADLNTCQRVDDPLLLAAGPSTDAAA